MTQTFTQEHKAKLEEYLATHPLSSGLGSKESACSIAAINLAMTGTLTDEIPDCMSEVLGQATIDLQDAMPEEMRNTLRYKTLLPDMAGTGREHEEERLDIILSWMWTVVLPQLQPMADENGFGKKWKTMCKLKTARAAEATGFAVDFDIFADVANIASSAAYNYDDAYYAETASAASGVVDFAAIASGAAADFWKTVDPIGVLERMTYLNVETPE
jgi:hypothetical protein